MGWGFACVRRFENCETTPDACFRFQIDMLQFVCDYCGNVKQPGEAWLSGLAAENVGTKAARREVVIDAAWRYERAVLPLAVHFCSIECKDRYMTELFQQPTSLLEIEEVEQVEPGRRVIRATKRPVTRLTTVRKRTTSRKIRLS